MKFNKLTNTIFGLLTSAFLVFNPIKIQAAENTTQEVGNSFFKDKLQKIEQIIESNEGLKVEVLDKYDSGNDKLVIVLPQYHYVENFKQIFEILKKSKEARDKMFMLYYKPLTEIENLSPSLLDQKKEMEEIIKKIEEKIRIIDEKNNYLMYSVIECQYHILLFSRLLKENGFDFFQTYEWPYKEINRSTVNLKNYTNVYFWDKDDQTFKYILNGQPLLSIQDHKTILLGLGAFVINEWIYGDDLLSYGVEDPDLLTKGNRQIETTGKFDIKMMQQRNEIDAGNINKLFNKFDQNLATFVIGGSHVFPNDYDKEHSVLRYLKDLGISYIVVKPEVVSVEGIMGSN